MESVHLRHYTIIVSLHQERVRVVLHCGTADCARHGQVSVYEEGRGAANTASKPSRIIPLHLIHNVQCLNASVPSPLPSPRSSGLFRMSMTESQLSQQQPCSLWGFMLLLQTGEAVELYAEAKEEQQLWIKHLNLLAMYPYSPLPEEPRVCPIKDSFRARLNPANFDAGEWFYTALFMLQCSDPFHTQYFMWTEMIVQTHCHSLSRASGTTPGLQQFVCSTS